MPTNNCSRTLAGLARDCKPSMGGVKRVLIAPFEDVKAVEVEVDKISAITMEGGKQFFEYSFKTGASTFTSTLQKDIVGGTSFVMSELMMQFNRMETTKRMEISALSNGDMAVIVEDNNGLFWYLGKDTPVEASAGDGQTGAARSDSNRYTITLQDNAIEFPFEVESSVIPALLSPGA